MSYIMNIAGKELLLHGANVLPEKVEPLLVEAHLIHVNVTRGHVLVAALQPRILMKGKNKMERKNKVDLGDSQKTHFPTAGALT